MLGEDKATERWGVPYKMKDVLGAVLNLSVMDSFKVLLAKNEVVEIIVSRIRYFSLVNFFD